MVGLPRAERLCFLLHRHALQRGSRRPGGAVVRLEDLLPRAPHGMRAFDPEIDAMFGAPEPEAAGKAAMKALRSGGLASTGGGATVEELEQRQADADSRREAQALVKQMEESFQRAYLAKQQQLALVRQRAAASRAEAQ